MFYNNSSPHPLSPGRVETSNRESAFFFPFSIYCCHVLPTRFCPDSHFVCLQFPALILMANSNKAGPNSCTRKDRSNRDNNLPITQPSFAAWNNNVCLYFDVGLPRLLPTPVKTVSQITFS